MKPSRCPQKWPSVKWQPQDILLGCFVVVAACYGVALFWRAQ